MRKIKSSTRFEKSFKRCKRRGYDVDKLYKIVDIIRKREFTPEEIYKYKVHKLSNDRRYSNCMELHIGGRSSDWLLIYHISNNTVYFDDTIVTLENTGTHADCFETTEISNELIWL